MKNTVWTHVYLELLRSTNHCILSFEEPELVSNFACMKKQGVGCTWDWPYPLTKVSSEIIDAMREIFQRKSIQFNQIMTTKTLKNFVSRTDNDVHNFLQGGKIKIRKQEPKVLAVESDNRGLEDLPLAYFGRVLEKISSVGKEIVNSWECCKLKNYAHCLFLQRVNAFFTLSFVVKARNNFSSETVDAVVFFIH